ncbi:hypothetical protein KIN20_013450 [Parelaphostrongylus tenuis]|uniref:Uncharacterized protein n=1 Tax=Parelaphostrongylus tenuis TaxID=148309 RepID=A0AAD5QNJ4_PARTN|nr:hypothetical protein KIN20_013450 [Parelaphostrongylus tenuis]
MTMDWFDQILYFSAHLQQTVQFIVTDQIVENQNASRTLSGSSERACRAYQHYVFEESYTYGKKAQKVAYVYRNTMYSIDNILKLKMMLNQV